jgi:hypothetical protein
MSEAQEFIDQIEAGGGKVRICADHLLIEGALPDKPMLDKLAGVKDQVFELVKGRTAAQVSVTAKPTCLSPERRAEWRDFILKGLRRD